jgi:O-antigen ligase
LYFGLGVAIVAILASVGLNIGAVAWLHDDPLGLEALNGRLLPSDAVVLLAFCFFLSLGQTYHRKSVVLSKWLPAVFFGLTLLLRHRTVWAVMVAGLILTFAKDRVLFRKIIPAGAFILCLMAGFTIVAGNAAQRVETQLSDSATNDDTWVWRVAGWQQLILGQQQSFTSVLFGRGIGGGYERFDPTKGGYNAAPPHSQYVMQFFNLGTFGLVLLLCLMIRPLRRLWKLSSTDNLAVEPSASAWTAVMVGIMVYSVAYDPPVEAYALLGIANAMLVQWDKKADPMSKPIRKRRPSKVYSRGSAESKEASDKSVVEDALPIIPNWPGFV